MARFKVYYTDENQCEVERPVVIRVPDGLDPMVEHDTIINQFREDYPGCEYECIEAYPYKED